mmetsp:Transcript_32775/g.47436  ORF Transcript_32775/g.47436 Transcript_32775/m.47436 type:complete len:477 (-) Transcript_32775:28-1458(-)
METKIDNYYKHLADVDKCWKRDWWPDFKGLFPLWFNNANRATDDCQAYPNFRSYLPYTCNICHRGPLSETNITRCARCLVAKYCCKEHQRADWKDHKEWCKVFSNYPADDKAESKDEWRRQANRQTNLVNHMMSMRFGKRPANCSVTNQMVFLQPRCRKCYAAGADVTLVLCPICQGVALCQECHGKENVHFHPAPEIACLSECDEHLINAACIGCVAMMKVPLMVESETDCSSFWKPKNWGDYLRRKRGDFELPEQMLWVAPVVACLTDHLTISFTIQHALVHSEKYGKQKSSSCTRLVVHIIGASAFEQFGGSKYVELVRLMPALKYIHIYLIGADIREAPSGPFNRPERIRDDCETRLTIVRGLYHNVAATLENADLLAAFHPGMHDADFIDSWTPTLEYIRANKPDIPCVFTGYNRDEVVKDSQVLRNAGLTVLMEPQGNPFRGLRPFLDPTRETADFIYSNFYYAMFKGSE